MYACIQIKNNMSKSEIKIMLFDVTSNTLTSTTLVLKTTYIVKSFLNNVVSIKVAFPKYIYEFS